MVFGFSAAVSGTKRNVFKTAASLLKVTRFNPLKMMGANRGVFGVHLGRLGMEVIRNEYEALFRHYAEGRIQPYIDKVFVLAEAAHAHQYIQDRKNMGKVLLSP